VFQDRSKKKKKKKKKKKIFLSYLKKDRAILREKVPRPGEKTYYLACCYRI